MKLNPARIGAGHLLGLLLVGSAALPAAEHEKQSNLAAAMATITTPEVKRHVDVLASDAFEGRDAGSRGGRAASTYLVEQLRRYPLKPAGQDEGYYQPLSNGFRNVLAMIEGSDSKLKDEVVMVCAHYDHVGYGTSRTSYGPIGLVHHGADDNASGTAGLLEVTEALTRLEPRPRRSILIAFFDGEEQGLLGSEHFVQHPTVPLDRIKLMINLDMIGRLTDNTVTVFGTRTSPGLRRLVSESNQESDLNLKFTRELKQNSDHHTFFARNIPILMLHTGLHGDYHRPSDTAEKIDSAGVRKISQLLFRIIEQLGNAPQLASFRPASRREAVFDEPNSPQPTLPLGRLGVDWKSDADSATGVEISNVQADSAASRAGLKAGDRIVKCGEQVIGNGGQLRAAIVVAPSMIELSIVRKDEKEPSTVKVELAGKPQRVGVSWWEDNAEPGTLIVAHVMADSPADQAGIRNGDRIVEIAGAGFKDGEEFRKRAAEMTGLTDVTVERQGRMRAMQIPLPAR
ncbi:MAG: M20/M25/M40 family metallo-hydrolase [Planctomycetes bacterium]|nr:M20/M25/M40 family metallo-hydrolase [Planctomycetota bacterium]